VNALALDATTPVAALRCRSLDVAVPGRRLVEKLSFDARGGEFIAVLGENGVGKTLTLHTLAGLRRPGAGEVLWHDRAVQEWPRRELARSLGLLAQNSEDPFPTTVLEAAVMGRHPHIGFWRWESPEDYEIARRCLAAVDLVGLEHREVRTLSGGERRRLAIATVLTQHPSTYVLDEPTNHLDPHHQVDVLTLFQERVRSGALVIASLHDATLAARYAHQALLLFGDGEWLFGTSEQVLTAGNLSRLYHTPMEEIVHRGRRVFIGA
jgi:iron complex transport system ATP-binding protein